MSELKLEELRKLYHNGSVIWTAHIHKRLIERMLNGKDIESVIMGGKIIEQYPDSFPHPSCLIAGCDRNKKPLHVVVACNNQCLTIVTAYFPTEDKFENDFETRKER
ncbi:MAG: DUF4258 domain-containing protein [Ruminococcus sp.]|nr:DUF4258 domain-containing protein [Ruminococcus sp.]